LVCVGRFSGEAMGILKIKIKIANIHASDVNFFFDANSNFIFSSEIGNFNVGGPVNQLIKKKA
jgi:hypothetical protein